MLVSVIIPVYNTATYLPACLDSILAQSYTDYECLLIDDGSTDGSSDICDAYARKDPRIHVFHRPNGGVSAARNQGVEEAQGDWICYVDSDDTVSPDYLSHLVSLIQGDSCLVMTSIDQRCHEHVITEDVVLHGEIAARYMLGHHILVDSGPVAKLFNREILLRHQLTFPLGVHYGEDMVYFYTYLNLVDTVVLSTWCDYKASPREGSLMSHYYPFESEYACFEACLREVTRFAGRLHLPQPQQTQLVWENKVAEAFIRCPKCLYASDNAYTWTEKMRYLRTIPVEYFHDFDRGFQPQGFSSRIIKFLISHRLFTLLLGVGALYESYHRK